jgi:hypothetical protein
MIAQVIDILFDPEVHWTVVPQQFRLRATHRRSSLLPWICLAFATTRAVRRRSRRRF